MVFAGNSRKNNDDLNDYYATEPRAVELLLNEETFSNEIWECACGEGHIANVLKDHGHWVITTDIIDRGLGAKLDFFAWNNPISIDIITNPPYNKAQQFVEHALEIATDGIKIAMFLKLTFLESERRRELFEKYPPKTIYVASKRLQCGKNGIFTGNSAVAYAWFVWVKGYKGETTIKWIN